MTKITKRLTAWILFVSLVAGGWTYLGRNSPNASEDGSITAFYTLLGLCYVEDHDHTYGNPICLQLSKKVLLNGYAITARDCMLETPARSASNPGCLRASLITLILRSRGIEPSLDPP